MSCDGGNNNQHTKQNKIAKVTFLGSVSFSNFPPSFHQNSLKPDHNQAYIYGAFLNFEEL